MAEITRVPIQKIAKGSVTKIWVGVLASIALGLGFAWISLPKTVEVVEIESGSGPNPASTDVVFVKYVGKLPDGSEFDRSPELPAPVPGLFPDGYPLPLEGMIPGFKVGLSQMQKGGRYELFIPADQAYGDQPPPQSQIAPGTDLMFEIELIDFMSENDFERRIGVMQQMMQSGGTPEFDNEANSQ